MIEISCDKFIKDFEGYPLCKVTKMLCEYINPNIGRCFEEKGPAYQQIFIIKQHLKEIEWAITTDGCEECPACGGLRIGNSHKPDCWLYNAIKEDD